jgi:Tfp pilus assembly protein PilO
MKTLVQAMETVAGRLGYRRWPWQQHALLALGALLAISASGVWFLQQQRASLQSLVQQQDSLQQSLSSAQRDVAKVKPAAEPDFSQRLPERSRMDEVIRQLAQLAEKHGVSVGGISLSHTATDAKAIGSVEASITLSGAYAPTKLLISELMSRHESLGIQTLSVRPRSNDAARLDWTLALSLYVRD